LLVAVNVGFCKLLLYPLLELLQVYEVEDVFALSVTVPFIQTGFGVTVGDGVAGVVFTVTEILFDCGLEPQVLLA
jgi:hypothetical protein